MFACLSCSGKQNDTARHDIKLYSRDIGNNNGTDRFLDCLVITNYYNKTFTIKQLYTIAKHYRDTAKATLPIASVDFIGQEPGYKLPPPYTEDIDEQRSHYIVGFTFYIGNNNKATSRDSLTMFTFWVNANPHTWLYIGASKKSIDKLLEKETPFDNTKMPVYDRQTKTIK